MSERKAPFVSLGKHLKYVRQQLRQSLAEVSGAVEIDEQYLERIEAGEERPAEDILLLLISYLGVQDREAMQLWELADYESDMPEQIKPLNDSQSGNKPVVMVVAFDPRSIYSDGLSVSINDAGVTLNFTQVVSQSQIIPVSRVGMSLDQAEEVLRTLQRALLKAKYTNGIKLLPPPKS
ncbi:MAG: helix-turn-helix transcriptional regulator [Candidatus Saccharimonadales bacterium]